MFFDSLKRDGEGMGDLFAGEAALDQITDLNLPGSKTELEQLPAGGGAISFSRSRSSRSSSASFFFFIFMWQLLNLRSPGDVRPLLHKPGM